MKTPSLIHLRRLALAILLLTAGGTAWASEADIKLPDLGQVKCFGGQVSGLLLMYLGLGVCVIGTVFGLIQYNQTKALDVH